MLDQLQDLLLILIGSSLVSNVVLSQFLGLALSWEYPRRWRPQQEWEQRLFLSSHFPVRWRV